MVQDSRKLARTFEFYLILVYRLFSAAVNAAGCGNNGEIVLEACRSGGFLDFGSGLDPAVGQAKDQARICLLDHVDWEAGAEVGADS